MTQWGLDTLFNPSKRHMDEEKRRLQTTREQIGDSSGGRRIDLESGKVVIRRQTAADETPTDETPTATDETAADQAEADEAEADEADADEAAADQPEQEAQEIRAEAEQEEPQDTATRR